MYSFVTKAGNQNWDVLCCVYLLCLLKPSIIAGLQRLVTAAYLLPLLELSEHDYGVTFPLPHHSPKILHCVLQRALCGNVVVLVSVALSQIKI